MPPKNSAVDEAVQNMTLSVDEGLKLYEEVVQNIDFGKLKQIRKLARSAGEQLESKTSELRGVLAALETELYNWTSLGMAAAELLRVSEKPSDILGEIVRRRRRSREGAKTLNAFAATATTGDKQGKQPVSGTGDVAPAPATPDDKRPLSKIRKTTKTIARDGKEGDGGIKARRVNPPEAEQGEQQALPFDRPPFNLSTGVEFVAPGMLPPPIPTH